MLILRYIILFWVTTRTSLHALVKTHQFSHTVEGCSTVNFLCLSDMFCCLFKVQFSTYPDSSDWSSSHTEQLC